MDGLEESLVKAIQENQKIDGELIIKAFLSVKDITTEDLERVCEPFHFELSVSCGENENTGESFYIFTGPLKRYTGLSAVLRESKEITFFGLNRITLAAYLYYTEGADFLGIKK